jgi:hypothetical protein
MSLLIESGVYSTYTWNTLAFEKIGTTLRSIGSNSTSTDCFANEQGIYLPSSSSFQFCSFQSIASGCPIWVNGCVDKPEYKIACVTPDKLFLVDSKTPIHKHTTAKIWSPLSGMQTISYVYVHAYPTITKTNPDDYRSFFDLLQALNRNQDNFELYRYNCYYTYIFQKDTQCVYCVTVPVYILDGKAIWMFMCSTKFQPIPGSLDELQSSMLTNRYSKRGLDPTFCYNSIKVKNNLIFAFCTDGIRLFSAQGSLVHYFDFKQNKIKISPLKDDPCTALYYIEETNQVIENDISKPLRIWSFYEKDKDIQISVSEHLLKTKYSYIRLFLPKGFTDKVLIAEQQKKSKQITFRLNSGYH